ncbi:helix-turn-helix domain-containing protein [Paenibacillus sp. J2TS4]|uniref:response regulator transcription factor n=1 Tax=Paenibacillus sp. J2TS4 TaxID=2807194 RepID=UPI001B1A733D|nr:helix-turn-helix domain-containing protein [Paenibacillus sp. J2TS4]GIP31581.1 DNA-binding response regulator [Paenibacillus sp. J2TS4]
MYNVLLVDDEMLDLEGMKQFIPWEDLGMKVAAAVNNAFEACDIIERLPIDILVSDVNMPNMSGLELARRAIEKGADIRIIFVSGFQEFSYVKQALSLKAYSYVLKPMDDNELIAALMKAKQDLENERKRRDVEEAYQRMIPMAKNDLLIRLLEGEYDRDYLQEMITLVRSYELDKLEWPVRAAVMELDELSWTHEDTRLSQQVMSRKFLYEVNNIGQKHGMPHCCKQSPHRIVLLVHDRRMKELVDELYDVVHANFPVTMTIGVGEPVYTLEQLHISFKQAMEAVDGKMFIGKGKLIMYEEASREPEMIDARTLDNRMEALFNALTEYELVLIYDEIEKLLESVSMLRSKFTVHNLAMFIIWKLDQQLKAREENLFDILGMELHNLNILLQFETINDIRSWLVRKTFEISEYLRSKSSSKNNKLIREMMQMMKDRMHDNITLKDVAQQFSFSPNYLGYMFKEETGKSFSEVLIQLRMERARDLLKEPSMKIYEIANQVGYRYLPYFSRQFKEAYGMTPMEYRKREL